METLHVAEVETPIGLLRLVSSERGLAYLELPHASGRGLSGWLQRCAQGARCVEGYQPNRVAAEQVVSFLEDKRRHFELALDLRGTPFQLDVWRALQDIPYGSKCSYAELAAAVGRPRAVRAVGAANGANPVSLVVPCHRVIASDGTLGGYAGGLELKARLLAMESAAEPGTLFTS
jgi:O-6-methylguanine DNA methyltransferase